MPRSRWLSFAGGVAVGYVFLHVLPQLAQALQVEEGTPDAWIGLLPYLLALGGVVVFYGLERVVRRPGPSEADGPFWTHIGSFSLYNAILAYLLVAGYASRSLPVLLYVVAVALHLLTTDYALWKDHHRLYRRHARWLLVCATIVGWSAAWIVALPPHVLDALFAFLAGAIVLNSLKEELPEERSSRFLPFLVGAALSGGLFVAVAWAG